MGARTLLPIEEFLELPDEAGKQELLEGELIEIPPAKPRHGLMALRLYKELEKLADKEHMALHEIAFRVDETTVLQPDVSYAPRVQLTEAGDDYPAGPPALAIEVASPSNRAPTLETKIRKYLANGAREVWVVYPNSRSVWVFRGNPPAAQSHEGTLTSEMFPGWNLSLSDLFA